MTYFRRGIVTEIKGETGIIRELTSWGGRSEFDIPFKLKDVRYIDIDPSRRDLSFGSRFRTNEDNSAIETLRAPIVGDVIKYDCKVIDRVLWVTAWTYENHFEECEDKLPRCVAKECESAPKLGKLHCAFHAPLEGELEAEDDYVPISTVVERAYRQLRNRGLAREAASQTPGDFL